MIVTAIFKAKPGKETELRNELHGGASASWNESGVRGYHVHELIDQPGTFMNVEVYENEAAFQSHLETAHVKSFIGKLDDLLAEPLDCVSGQGVVWRREFEGCSVVIRIP
jgi:quinol monooxygenase YgiN